MTTNMTAGCELPAGTADDQRRRVVSYGVIQLAIHQWPTTSRITHHLPCVATGQASTGHSIQFTKLTETQAPASHPEKDATSVVGCMIANKQRSHRLVQAAVHPSITIVVKGITRWPTRGVLIACK
jgi:hypothetical protein